MGATGATGAGREVTFGIALSEERACDLFFDGQIEQDGEGEAGKSFAGSTGASEKYLAHRF